ncbi:unnamed protein product [Nippostrongylus brasiliensis]|uniref:Reverse transcriptase domain-containing protein n=1 Tax=Nippostrongylus brasiliensis TaxID=27835 RepID=A0A0N4XF78_NIPBR|nr:unnamed protein product [Nippostrongylus brasiliensis]
MPRGKAPGTRKLNVELLQACGEQLCCALAKRFTVYISECNVPAACKKSSAVLLFKKGDEEDLENYRKITLLPDTTIVLVTKTPEHGSRMLNGLQEAGKEAGLTINTTKTKVLRNSFCLLEPVLLQGVALENVREYVYLGRLVSMKNDLAPEIERKKRAGWAAFNSIKTVLERASNSKLRADLFNSTVLPALCYACETWSLTRKAEDQLCRMQISIKRRMAGVTLRKQPLLRLQNNDVRAMTKVRDIVLHADEAKHHFPGHVIRRRNGRWKTSVIQWRPNDKKTIGVLLPANVQAGEEDGTRASLIGVLRNGSSSDSGDSGVNVWKSKQLMIRIRIHDASTILN